VAFPAEAAVITEPLRGWFGTSQPALRTALGLALGFHGLADEAVERIITDEVGQSIRWPSAPLAWSPLSRKIPRCRDQTRNLSSTAPCPTRSRWPTPDQDHADIQVDQQVGCERPQPATVTQHPVANLVAPSRTRDLPVLLRAAALRLSPQSLHHCVRILCRTVRGSRLGPRSPRPGARMSSGSEPRQTLRGIRQLATRHVIDH
jgi:hypothetical protein